MPKVSNYKNALIYKIVCNDCTINNLYAGSRCELVKRRHKHKYDCTNPNSKNYNFYVYKFIRENGGWENWTLIKICDFPCNSKYEMLLEERRLISVLQADLNKRVPSRTPSQYRQDFNEDIKKKQLTAYHINKETILEKQKLKYNCGCGSCIRISDKSKHLKKKKHCQFIKQSDVVL